VGCMSVCNSSVCGVIDCSTSNEHCVGLGRFPLQLDSGQTVECTVAKYFWERYRMKLQSVLNYPTLSDNLCYSVLHLSYL